MKLGKDSDISVLDLLAELINEKLFQETVVDSHDILVGLVLFPICFIGFFATLLMILFLASSL